jgi:ribulose-phosphate 3-epimerase
MTAAPPRPVLAASMLTADFAALGAQCGALEQAGVDLIHWDLMDGVAVPSLSFGPDVIAACRQHTALPFEAHVMSRLPDGLIEPLAAAGCASIIVHPDWLAAPRRTLQRIVDSGLEAGVALSPGTPLEHARWQLDLVSTLLIMTVEPGFGGQRHIPAMTAKVTAAAALIRAADHPVALEVDGGIGPATIAAMRAAGANRFVVGSALWRAESFASAIAALERNGTVQRQEVQS